MNNDYRRNVHLTLSEQSDDIKNLDRKIQNLIIGVSKDLNTFDGLKDLIQGENTSSKEHISQAFQKVRWGRFPSLLESLSRHLALGVFLPLFRIDSDSNVQHRETIAAEESYERLLESLYFPDIHARQEGIDEAHKQTFEWIFDKSGNEIRPWHPFIDWLENGRGTYWISGKAGSGKSTLMNLICQDPRTNAALRIWSGTNEFFMPNFFFWSPGSQLQKSLAGLLRSLIYQIMKRYPQTLPVLAKSMDSLHQLPTWTERRLRATLQSLLAVGLEQCRLCIFIDGLDEFHGNHATLLDLIRNLREITRVKFCLSSRPYSAFRDELASSPMLKLQDLTEPDIRRYVSDKLERVPLKASHIDYSSFKIKDAIDTIVWRAEGVFLWVNLAVRDQLEGIRNGDDTEQLQERLQVLPTEIEGLYGHMLQRVEKVYRKEVARYIRSALDVEGRWSLFQFALAEHKRIDDILLFSSDISVSDIHQNCKSIRERIDVTCKGFLEVREREDFAEWQTGVPIDDSWSAEPFSGPLEDRHISLEQLEELKETKYLKECTQLDFLHRTAFDFFTENEQGKDFLKQYASANPHPQILLVKAKVAGLIVFPLPIDDVIVSRSISSIMDHAFIAEDKTRVAQLALMDLINRSITLLCERSRNQQPDSHWCRVWGDYNDWMYFDDPFNYDTPRIGRHQPRKDWFFPVDFLGFTAWHGLDKYIEHALDSDWERRKPGTADYLLGCTVNGFSAKYSPQGPLFSSSHHTVIEALLNRGADPNTKLFKGTVWSFFLRVFHHLYSYYYLPQWEFAPLRNSVLAFLRSGSNVNEKLYCNIVRNSHATYSEDSPSFFLIEYWINLHLSARSILQRLFAKSPEFSEIEHTLIASGACLYSECTKIFFHVVKGADRHGRWVNLRPSEQQLNRATEAWEKDLARDQDKRYKILNRQLVALFREVDIPQLYEQAPPVEEWESDSFF